MRLFNPRSAGSGPWHSPLFVATARGARMAYRDCGPAEGEAWLVLHGGPGGAAHPGLAAPLQLACQRALLPDQRGAGRSSPAGRVAGNTTHQLVADLEVLRCSLGVDRWAVLAGSWGTVLALRYAQCHPERVTRVVLRGAFAARRQELVGLLRADARRDAAVFANAHWPRTAGHHVAPALARLEQVLRCGAPAVSARHVVRCWSLMEQRSALRGLWRSLVHASGVHPPSATAQRRAWAQLKRQQRRALAGLLQRRTVRSDHRGLQKFRVQAHYLRRRCFLPAGGLDSAVRSLATHGIPSDWVHGRFDAVCPVANSQRWWRQLELAAPGLARNHRPVAGHLSGEPGMHDCLAQVVRHAR